MKFTCKTADLDRQLQHVSRIITIRHSLPVLSNILLETDGEILRISGTDLELALTTHITATIEQEGAFTIPAKVFQEFIHQNPDEEITCWIEGAELVCKSKKVQARIAGLDPEEYPALPKVVEKQKVLLPAGEVVEVWKQVVIACATDPARPVLTGVLADFDKNMVTFAATDSFRLAERKLSIIPLPEPLRLLIPARTIQEVIRVAGALNDLNDIEMIIGEQQIIVRMGSVDLYSRLLTGNFPKYQAIIPTTTMAVAQVPSAEILQALRLATVFSTSGIANIALEIQDDGTLTVSSYGSQRGTTAHTLYAVIVEGFQPVRAAFNARFLIDACSAAGSDHLNLRFSGPTSPLVIGTEDPNYLQLVMPIRLD